MDRGMAAQTVPILAARRLVVKTRNRRRERVGRIGIGYRCMTLEAQLADSAPLEHLGIRRAVRRMARRAPLKFQCRMLEHKRSLLIAVTFYTSRVGPDC